MMVVFEKEVIFLLIVVVSCRLPWSAGGPGVAWAWAWEWVWVGCIGVCMLPAGGRRAAGSGESGAGQSA